MNTTNTNNLPDEKFNANLDADEFDDIQSSVSQKPVNSLCIGNSSSVCKITLPKTSLIDDDRFWEGQVNKDDMSNKQNCEEQQIFTLAPTTSSSPDSFTPFKTKKDRLPDDITQWRVSLCGADLLIIGYDKDGDKPIDRVCRRRISGYIFHDSNNIVCSLLGPSNPDSNLPPYILEKFKMGIPEDWRKVIQYWRQFVSLGCPSKYRWPSIHQSWNQTTRNYYDTETDSSFAESNRSCLTTDQLRKKIAKWKRRLDVQILKESMSDSNYNSTSNREISVRNDSNLLQQTVKKNHAASAVNNLAAKMVNSIVNRESLNENTFSSIKTAPKEQNDSLVCRNNVEIVSFYNKILLESTETSNIEVNTKYTASEDILHLPPVISEEPKTNLHQSNTNIEQVNSGSDIFSKNEIVPNITKTFEKNSATSSFVSLNFSELSSTQNTSNKKDLSLEEKINKNINNSEINVSSRGRVRVPTLAFWKGNSFYKFVKKEGVKIIQNKSQNCTDVERIKEVSRKKSESETSQEKSQSEYSPEKTQPGEFLKPQNIDTINKCDRKKGWKKSQTEKLNNKTNISKHKLVNLPNIETSKRSSRNSNISQVQKKLAFFDSASEESTDEMCLKLDSLSKKSTELIPLTADVILNSPNVEVIKGGRKKEWNKTETDQSQSYASPEKCSFQSSKIPTVLITDVVLNPPNVEIMKGGRKKGWNKTETEQSQSYVSPEKCSFQSSKIPTVLITDVVLNPPNVEVMKGGRKKGWNKTETDQSQSYASPEKCSFQSSKTPTVLITDVVLNPLNVEVMKGGRKKGWNKTEIDQSQSYASPENCSFQSSKTPTVLITDVVLNPPNVEVMKGGRKKEWNKTETDQSQSYASPEKCSFQSPKIPTVLITDVVLNPPNVEVMKGGRKKGWNKTETDQSKSDVSPEKCSFQSSKTPTVLITDVVLNPPNVEVMKGGRKKGWNKTETEQSQSYASPEKCSFQSPKTPTVLITDVVLNPPNVEVMKEGRKKEWNKTETDQSQSYASPEKCSFQSPKIPTVLITDVVLNPPNVEVMKGGRKKGWNKTETDQKSDVSPEKCSFQSSKTPTVLITDVVLNPPNVEVMKGGRKKGWNKTETHQSQSYASPEKCSFQSPKTPTVLITDVVLNPPNVEVMKGGRKKGWNKTETDQSNSDVSPEKCSFHSSKKSTELIPTTDVMLNLPNVEVRKRGRKKGWNKAETNHSQLDSSQENIILNPVNDSVKQPKSLNKMILSKLQNADEFSKHVDIETIKKHDRKKGWNNIETKNSKTESSPEKIQKTSNSLKSETLLKPSDIIKRPGRKKGYKNDTNNESVLHSDVFSDITVGPMSQRSSVIDISSANNNISISSRGRRRVSTLPFWQGYCLTVSNGDVIIAKSTDIKISPNTKSIKRNSIVPIKSPKKSASKTRVSKEEKIISKQTDIKISPNKRKITTNSVDPVNIASKTKIFNEEVIISKPTDSKISPNKRKNKTNSVDPSLKKSGAKTNITNNLEEIISSPITRSQTRKKLNVIEITRTSPRKNKLQQIQPKLNSLRRSKKLTAENNYNFTVQDITCIEENIPQRTKNMNKKSTTVSVKQTAKFKVPKPRKSKKVSIPSDPQELYLLVNKHEKKEQKSQVKIIPKETQSNCTEPKRRKLFLNNDWMQSEECFENLTQNNPDGFQISPKFVIRFNPSVNPHETDEEMFSEISMRI